MSGETTGSGSDNSLELYFKQFDDDSGSGNTNTPPLQWYHVVSALIDLPEDQISQAQTELALLARDNIQAQAILNTVLGYGALHQVARAGYRSVLRHTDQHIGGYVPVTRVVNEAKAYVPKTELFLSRAVLADFDIREAVRANLLTNRIAWNSSFRLLNPMNVIALDQGKLSTPSEIRAAEPEIQLAYQAFRLVVPDTEGRGRVTQSEVDTALLHNASRLLDMIRDNKTFVERYISGEWENIESAARAAVKKLGKLSIFSVTRPSLISGERWMRLK